MSDNTNELKSQLEHPEKPEKPEETPETPETPEIPETPEEPEETSETPESPETPEAPETPETPEEGGEQFVMPDKFKGKSAEEIAKSYKELEGMVEKKAKEKADEIIKKKAEGKEPEKPEKPEEPEETPPEGEIDYGKMTPNQFAKTLLAEIDKRAEEKARKIVADSSKARTDVRVEIEEAKKDHPLLKDDSDVGKAYRSLVLAIVEAASSRGKKITLKEACSQVDTFKGEGGGKKTEEQRLKKAKAQVEIGGGAAPGGGPDTEEQRIKKGMLRQSRTGDLGGL